MVIEKQVLTKVKRIQEVEEEVTVYTTTDKREFNSSSDANIHQSHIDAPKLLGDWPTIYPGEGHNWYLVNDDEELKKLAYIYEAKVLDVGRKDYGGIVKLSHHYPCLVALEYEYNYKHDVSYLQTSIILPEDVLNMRQILIKAGIEECICEAYIETSIKYKLCEPCLNDTGHDEFTDCLNCKRSQ